MEKGKRLQSISKNSLPTTTVIYCGSSMYPQTRLSGEFPMYLSLSNAKDRLDDDASVAQLLWCMRLLSPCFFLLYGNVFLHLVLSVLHFARAVLLAVCYHVEDVSAIALPGMFVSPLPSLSLCLSFLCFSLPQQLSNPEETQAECLRHIHI